MCSPMASFMQHMAYILRVTQRSANIEFKYRPPRLRNLYSRLKLCFRKRQLSKYSQPTVQPTHLELNISLLTEPVQMLLSEFHLRWY